MNGQRPRFVRLQAVVAALTALVAFSLFTPATTSADDPVPHPGTARFELDFLSDMIDHHAMAVETGELCPERAVHEDLLAMCADIVATQQQEIEAMQGWLASWYGISHEPEMNAGEMKELERLAARSGEEFEIELIQMMSQHHAKAVKMASRCVDRADHAELVDLCGQIVATQTAEIQELQTWLCDWYGICRPGPGGAG